MKIGIQLSKDPKKFQQFVDIIKEVSSCPSSVKFVHIPNENTLHIEMPKLDVLACYYLNIANFQIAQNLKWIHIGAAGVEEFMFPAILKSHVALTNSRGINAVSAAEFVFGQILYFAKQFLSLERFRKTHTWDQWEIARRMQLLSGKTVGLLGFGSLGKEIAKRAKGFNMNVLALRRLKKKNGFSRIADEILLPDEMDSLLERSDYLVIALPQTPITENLIGRAQFLKMKPSAILINISRGKIIQEPSLIEALKNQHIFGAALDVFATEPLSENSPLFNIPNVFLSPHIAGNFPEYQQDVAKAFANELNRFLNGKTFKNRVCKKRKY